MLTDCKILQFCYLFGLFYFKYLLLHLILHSFLKRMTNFYELQTPSICICPWLPPCLTLQFPQSRCMLFSLEYSYSRKLHFSFSHFIQVIVCLRYYDSEFHSLGGYEQQKLIANSSGGWGFQDQGTSRFGAWWGLPSWFLDGRHFTVFSHSGKDKGCLWSLIYKVTNLIHPTT